jgi:hypothetical protein
MLAIMGVVMVLTSIMLSFASYKETAGGIQKTESGKHIAEQRLYVSIGFTIMTLLMIPGIVWLKRKTRIIITPEGIEYKTAFNKKYIPWSEVKDVKIQNPNSSVEKCRIKGKNAEIAFNTFFQDNSEKYSFTDKGVFDEHGNPIPISISKGKLYKEIKTRVKRWE